MEDLEWQAERLRLAAVIAVLRRQLAMWEQTERQRKSDMNALAKHLWEEVTIDPQHSSDSAVSLSQQTLVWAEQHRSYQHAVAMRQAAEMALPSPYFGRIDFRETGRSDAEPVYIGARAVVDNVSERHLVVDWRSPVASLYYDYALGEAEYETPDGRVNGRIELKRQYRIRDGQLVWAIDTGMPIGDTALQEVLSRQADPRMHNIVATIQREQNAVIRDDSAEVLIVQGAAGSGKTSIALQRIAYLLYKYRNRISSEQIVLFSPNRLFADYVSGVLPELGEANMRQMTLQDYTAERLGPKQHVEDRYALTEKLLAETDESARLLRSGMVSFKSSAAYLHIVQRYIARLGREGFVPLDVMYRTNPIVTAETMLTWFYGRYADEPIHARLDKIKDKILELLAEYAERQTKRVYRQLRDDPRYLGTNSELMERAKQRVGERIEQIREEVEAYAYVDMTAMYTRLAADAAMLRELAAEAGVDVPADWEQMSAYSADLLSRSVVPYEDSAALLYMMEELEKRQTFNPVRHVLIDEVQDYGALQLYMLRKLFPRARFTLLGDLNQSILAEAGLSGYEAVADLYGRDSCRLVRLERSYRSTQEIASFAAALLPDGERVQPIARSGARPTLVRVCGDDAAEADRRTAQLAAADAAALLADGTASVAVLCRTQAEAFRAYAALRPLAAEVRLLTRDDVTLGGSKLLVMPSYLAKGLEFDAVLVWDASAEAYSRESERRLFYTVCTRALHELRLYAAGEPTPLLHVVDPSLYAVEEDGAE